MGLAGSALYRALQDMGRSLGPNFSVTRRSSEVCERWDVGNKLWGEVRVGRREE